ncbi:MAG: hypothetical protein OEZ36_09625 [Spirochaetota bacterium]|nr:hypothetical protein [Spirochaetota bacterium]
MINPESIKKVMNSFNTMKSHLQELEKSYSQQLEKSELLCQQDSAEPTSIN